MSFGFAPAPAPPPQNPTAPGYTTNIEFQLDPIDPGDGAANRDAILAEQQRILTIFNDWFIAQKLKLLGQVNARVPQLSSEQSNRDQLQMLIKDIAETNVNKATMTGLINNFGQQYCKFITERDAVEAQRQLNEIEKARMQGIDFLPPAAQTYVRVCQVGVVLSLGGTFGTLIAIWTGANAVTTGLQSAKTAGLQLLVMGILQFICLCMRTVVVMNVGKLMIPPASYGKDKLFITRIWDVYIVVVLTTIISFGAWMWTKSNVNFGKAKLGGDKGGVGYVNNDKAAADALSAAAAAAASAATAAVSKVLQGNINGIKVTMSENLNVKAMATGMKDVLTGSTTRGLLETSTKVFNAAATTFLTATRR
ncbi:hypothetical protein TWF225_009302 [Orbilia oligospora]|uniref:Uncharacterized protein n=1 Tax=Orbilia oligospora TaxID=2813651 RepID=A0A7C8TRJ7_ORBOL|nr:hypothetical protein TWF751_001873 [Orbilia oligospora]KAF3193759.1 hypothetical protein TWF225_009302 [Orbilia oligospora]KAF3269943.1 hypothetical protein TWF217_008286 [Orbilia oligospora]KAF3270404.1 hypothetical protein TWF128_004177 [Orbilia oligospora]KAF3298109.1 hypothetical protein TWF132_004250 [Orbilia oligospora]